MTNATQKFIVWDWNGTLFDDAEAMLGGFNHIFERFGYTPTDMDGYRQHYAIPVAQMYRNHGFSAKDVATATEDLNHGYHQHYEALALKMALREGALELLNDTRAHGVRSYILSNHLVEPIKAQLRRLEAEHLLDEVLAYADSATQFKDMTKSERMRRYMVQHGLVGSNGVIVGDSAEEVHIGRDFGMATVVITGGGVSEQILRAAGPDFVVHSMAELRPILKQGGLLP